MSNNSLDNTLKFFFDIAFEDELNKIQSSYLGHPYFKENQYNYIAEQNVYLRSDLIEEDDVSPEIRLDIIDQNKFLRLQLKWRRSKTIGDLHNNKPSKIDLKEFYDQLKTALDEIQNKALDKHAFKIVLEETKPLINRLKATYANLIEYHPVFKFSQELNLSESFFETKDLPYTFFKTLFKKTVDIDLIDEVVNSEEEFLEVFTAPKATVTIQFRQPNSIIAYYFYKISGFFYNFNPKRIEEAKAFKNKQGKLLTASDLYNAKKRPTKDLLRWVKKIDSSIDPLIEEYQI